MKKTAKSVLLMMVMAVMLLALTGCGGNKLVATKESEDSMMGKYKETVEITFKDDKADKVTMTLEFEDKDKADAIASIYKLASGEVEGMKVEQKGKKIIMTMDSKAFANQEGVEESSSKEDIKKALEEEGYKVK